MYGCERATRQMRTERAGPFWRRRSMSRIAASASLTLMMAALTSLSAGCSDCVPASADCGYVVRYEGAVYAVYGETSVRGRRVGSAEQAACDDVGTGCDDEPRGAYFPNDPDSVAVHSIKGYPTSRVLGVESFDGRLQVGVAQSMHQDDIEKIIRELTRR